MNGDSIRACVTTVGSIAGKSITTLEGLGTAEKPHPLQSAFIAEQAIQCGYCASGIIITAAALLKNEPSADEQTIKKALSGHLCRCGAQPRMLKAIRRAAAELSGSQVAGKS
jgi:nicotinate dehydrogenase subunit A